MLLIPLAFFRVAAKKACKGTAFFSNAQKKMRFARIFLFLTL